ncbi:MAG: squalene--hopene cyclase [Verrucomicrobia bacterium]|nr:squalene--hopene cyclase [Verrucomicrobiota bacterium]
MSALDRERLNRAVARVNQELLAALGPDGHWVGELSSSALSTATAVTALSLVQREQGHTHHAEHITRGLDWLAQNQNTDGGWGDTTLSLSNLSTTTLCWAAFGAVQGADAKFRSTLQEAKAWLTERAGGLAPDQLAPAIIARYGKDRTFSVPILTMCALAGRLGSGRDAWRHVIPLPFELAACPHTWFAALRLPVVSYALPALIAIGQVRHIQSPSPNPIARLARHLTRDSTLRKLTTIQPENGGFLEATPLTSFVTMSLAGSGQVNHPVANRGVEFLIASQRADGSWPIDTNLATWVTTLAVNALGANSSLLANHTSRLRSWLLNQQYRTIHPYTQAAPGGWAWTDLPGGVPDADDTSGALLALRQLGPVDDVTREAAAAGITWLLDLQNRDGGIPTFCRGWGALPFDQSSADITAHAIRAWLAWFDDAPSDMQPRLLSALERALNFLIHVQHPDGSWLPLWFGNQHMRDDQNPTYGTTKVLIALSEAIEFGFTRNVQGAIRGTFKRAYESEAKAELWLICSQRGPQSGWGGGRHGPASAEETALVVEAFTALLGRAAPKSCENVRSQLAVESGTHWLLSHVESGEWTQPSPIGFYFAKLWYYEKLYPMIFTAAALNRVQQLPPSPL